MPNLDRTPAAAPIGFMRLHYRVRRKFALRGCLAVWNTGLAQLDGKTLPFVQHCIRDASRYTHLYTYGDDIYLSKVVYIIKGRISNHAMLAAK
jgi:hypothetical protein